MALYGGFCTIVGSDNLVSIEKSIENCGPVLAPSSLRFPSISQAGGMSDCFVENFLVPVVLLWLFVAQSALYLAGSHDYSPCVGEACWRISRPGTRVLCRLDWRSVWQFDVEIVD